MSHIKLHKFSGWLASTWILLSLSMAHTVLAADDETGKVLKVCADPYMLPFSNKDEQGYENRIAGLFAKKLGMQLTYEWFPQRLGFIRNTLRKEIGSSGEYACDLVITAPEKFDLAATTEPYYTTSYMLVYVKGRGLDEVTDPQTLGKFMEEKKPDLKFGLSDQGPAQLWAFYQGLIGNVVPYQGQPGDPTVSPGQRMIEELIAGNIDTTVIWGPTAGYYAHQYRDRAELVLLPMKDDPNNPEMKFVYSMAMAVRFGEKEWKETVNTLIRENKPEIEKILSEFYVPLIKK